MLRSAENALQALEQNDTSGFLRAADHLDLSFLDQDRLQRSYNRLVRAGLMNGLEAVIERTGIAPIFELESVLRGYDVLVACGRLEGVDALFQLSQVPVHFNSDAVQMAYSFCLFTGRVRTIAKLFEVTHVPFHPGESELTRAQRYAESEKDLPAMAILSEIAAGNFSLKRS